MDNKDTIKIRVYAKVNLSLYVGDSGKSGYHSVDSVAASVNIFDTLTVRKSPRRDIRVYGCPDIEQFDNSAYKGADAIMREFNTLGADIVIEKGIPFSSGLGGSSADAAAAIYAMCTLHGIDVNSQKVQNLAADCGCDVPYMLTGGFCRLTGRGEIVDPLDSSMRLNIAVIKPYGGVSTAECYNRFDTMFAGGALINGNDRLCELLAGDKLHFLWEKPYSGADAKPQCCLLPEDGTLPTQRDYSAVKAEFSALCVNSLQPAAVSINPGISVLVDSIKENFSNVACFMTGSGSAVCAIFESAEKARKCADFYRHSMDFCAAVTTVPWGIEVV